MTSAHWQGRITARTIAALAAVAVAAGCGVTGQGAADTSPSGTGVPRDPEPGTFTLASQPWIGNAPWALAEDKAYDRNHDLDLEVVQYDQDRRMLSDLKAGRADAAALSAHNALRLVEAGVEVQIVALEDVSEQADAVLARDGITTIYDLLDSTRPRIAFEPKSTSELLLRDALDRRGMSMKDITPVRVPAAEAAGALAAGKADAAVTYEPYVSAAVAEGASPPIHYAEDARTDNLITDVLVVRTEVIEDRPGQVAAALAVWHDAVEEYLDRPEPSQEVMAKALGHPADQLRPAFEGLAFYTTRESATYLRGYAKVGLGDVAKLANEADIIQGSYTRTELSDLVNDQFARAVVAREGE